MVKNEKILITGAGGFVGSNLVRYFINNYQIHVIIKKQSNPWRLKDVKRNIHIHYTSLLDQTNLTKTLKKISPHFIFHLAAHGSYPTQQNVRQMIETNVLGTYNLLESSKDIDYQCFINTGSSSEYGHKKKPMNENDSLNPISFYAVTKASASQLCKVFSITYRKPIITLRLFSVYGPFEDGSRLIPTAIKAAMTKKPLLLTQRHFRRDFIYIKDVLSAYEKAMELKIKGQEIFNVGTGKQYTNLDIANVIKLISPSGLKIEKGKYPPRAWDTNFWLANIKKTKSVLKWCPQTDLESGLKKTYLWFSKNLHLYDDNSK